MIASIVAHFGEEPALSGTRGSGCIFLGNCNLQCVFCQNWQISQGDLERLPESDTDGLAASMLRLQSMGCHNINLVSPTHFVPQIVRALCAAAERGLRLPIVFNSNGYDSVEVLRLLDGVIDIYLPDLKYGSNRPGQLYSGAEDYWDRARPAIREMHRQVGNLVTDDQDIAQRGLIVRHLILPNDQSETESVLTWLARELSPEVTVSLMSQYYPANRASEYPLLNRRLAGREYSRAAELLEHLRLENGWAQEPEESPDCYRPDFDRESPFER